MNGRKETSLGRCTPVRAWSLACRARLGFTLRSGTICQTICGSPEEPPRWARLLLTLVKVPLDPDLLLSLLFPKVGALSLPHYTLRSGTHPSDELWNSKDGASPCCLGNSRLGGEEPRMYQGLMVLGQGPSLASSKSSHFIAIHNSLRSIYQVLATSQEAATKNYMSYYLLYSPRNPEREVISRSPFYRGGNKHSGGTGLDSDLSGFFSYWPL